MTDITEKLIELALYDSYKVLKSVAKRKDEKVLYTEKDVESALSKIHGIEYNNLFSPHPNVNVTFLKNGHLVGAAMIQMQITRKGYDNINILFTGDYNNKNMFFDVPAIPQKLRYMPLIVVQEATYGNMDSVEISKCFVRNVMCAISKDRTVIVPVFSLGRAQEILYVLKCMQEEGKLSQDIPIYFDGKLAMRYTGLYLKQDIGIKEDMKEFLPQNLQYVDKLMRRDLLDDTNKKIIVTTSGMGSYGPAQTYIPRYLGREDALIQFTGYTAEGTLGNRLKVAKKGETVDVAGLMVVKRADVEYTTEFSAHAKADEMIKFLQQFNDLKLVLVNHGETQTKEIFAKRIATEVNPGNVGILGIDSLGSQYCFKFDSHGLIKTIPTKFL